MTFGRPSAGTSPVSSPSLSPPTLYESQNSSSVSNTIPIPIPPPHSRAQKYEQITHDKSRQSLSNIVQEDSLQLTERESIFALHYLPSKNDHETAVEGGQHPLSAEQRITSTMEVLQPVLASPPKLFSPTFSTYASTDSHSKSRERNVGKNGLMEGLEDQKSWDPSGRLQAIRRVASEVYPWTKTSKARNSSDNMQSQAYHDTSDQHLREQQGRLAAREDVAPQEQRESRQRDDRGSSMRQALRGVRSDRSSSRGRSHVEKSIEATLDLAKNVRSRKSSQIMGVFRESADALPTTKQRLQDEHGEGRELSNSESRPTSSRTNNETMEDLTTVESDLQNQDANRPLLIRDHSSDITNSYCNRGSRLSLLQQRQPSVSLSNSDPSSPIHTQHDPYFRQRDETQRASQTPATQIPEKLLQEIREYHNLVPVRAQGSHSTTIVPKTNDTDQASEYVNRRAMQGENSSNEEQEEHISSAVYFPHPGPSPEEIEQITSPGERSPESQVIEAGTVLDEDYKSVSLEHKRSSSDILHPEHIDISVQSKHEKSIFHGNYEPPDEELIEEHHHPKLPPISENLVAPVFTSESEAESSDEIGRSSQTDDNDTTPTATPQPQSYMQRRKRTLTGGPKGAVILEPYSHQVGGHSTIFRFSRRAVCKQLNNRENEFYERIERRHPDMLKFLPRYIGVLNVTFSKGPKETKDSPQGDENATEQIFETQTKMTSTKEEIVMTASSELSQDRPIQLVQTENQPRIVSQSQEVGEVPQVILNQNRHIVPSSLFGLPERPRSAGPHQGRRSALTTELARESDVPAHEENGNISQTTDGTPRWGRTIKNSRLREEVLREVFGPTQINHRKRHGQGHTTLPRPREPLNRRRSNLSVETFEEHSRQIVEPTAGTSLNLGAENSVLLKADNIAKSKYSSSASVYEDVSNGLEKIRTTIIRDSDSANTSDAPRIKRRHSGIGLRRWRKSVSGDEKPDLEYFEEEKPQPDVTADVFSMDDDARQSNPPVAVQRATAAAASRKNQDTSAITNGYTPEFAETASVDPNEVGSVKINHVEPIRLPLNPKEAKLVEKASPDQRVVYFLLLEDLTAGMGRPCVLDLKMGTRQYGVEANKKKMESQRRKCKTTTSQQLGVRICGMQTFDVKTQKASYEDKYFGRDVKAGREFRDALTRFLYDGVDNTSIARRIPIILHKLEKLESMIRRLPGYRFYASSLLMLYDAEPHKSKRAREDAARRSKSMKKDSGRAADNKEDKPWAPPIELKIVDFANCVTGEDDLPPTAVCPPQHPGDVDRGYLRGLRTLKIYFKRILKDIHQGHYVERGEGEAMQMRTEDLGKEGLGDSMSGDETDEVSI